MHKLANLSDHERRRIVDDFIDEVFGGVDANPALVSMLRSAMPDLPEDPTSEQIEAWVELAELVQDDDFRASIRRMAEYQADQKEGNAAAESELHGDLVQVVRKKVEAARTAGIEPSSERAKPIVRELVLAYARAFGRADDADTSRWVLERMNVANDRRVERYLQMLGLINSWPPPPILAPTFDWCIQALRQHAVPDARVMDGDVPEWSGKNS